MGRRWKQASLPLLVLPVLAALTKKIPKWKMSAKALEAASRKEGKQCAYHIDFIPCASNSMLQKLISLSVVIRISTTFLFIGRVQPILFH